MGNRIYHLGSTMTMVDQYGAGSGPVFDYFPYGKQAEEEVSTDAPVTPTFTGKELDLFENDFASEEDGEGWYYFGARYYDADVGRWTSTDPKRQYIDLYLYGGNNPINRFDPDGGQDFPTHSNGLPYTATEWLVEMFNFASTKDGQRQIALIGLQEVETANNVLNTATNVGAVLAPEPYTKGGFLLANTVSDATAIGIDVAQCSLNPSTENAADIGVSTGGLLLGKVFGNMLNKWFGALSPTSKNPNQFRDITTGQFSKTSTGKIGQNLDAGVGQVINIAQDKVTK